MTPPPPAAAATLDKYRTPHTRLIQPNTWPWVTGIAIVFVLLHSVIIEQTLRTAFKSISIPDSYGALTDHSLPARWFLILRYGLPGSWDPNWSHVLFVPLISLYFVGQRKQQLLSTQRRLCWPGLYIALFGMLCYSAGLFPIRNDMARGYSMVLTLFGIVLFLLGPGMMRHLWFPILYLAFSVKVSDRIWSIVASALQGVVSQGGYWSLEILSSFIDFRVNLRGHTLEVIPIGETLPQSLNVAEACSGMRSLMTFLVLGTAMAFLGTRPVWQRITLLASILPVAIAMNTARITTLGLLTAFGNHDMAHGDFHTFIGLLMLIPAAGTFALIGWILNKLFVESGLEPGIKDINNQSSPVTTKTNDTKHPIQYKEIGTGFALGLTLSLCVFGSYLGTMFAIRPELINENLSRPLAITALVFIAAVLIFTLILSKNLCRKAIGTKQVFAFSLVIGSLLTASTIQGAVIRTTQFVLIKNAVPLRKSLESLPTEIGNWTLVLREPRLSAEIQDELGTDQYVTLIYEDLDWPRTEPGGLIRLHVPYYTGTVDTVPHVPDRCFVAGGVLDSQISLINLEIPSDRYSTDQLTGHKLYLTENNTTVRVPGLNIPATRYRYRQPTMQTVDNELSTVFYFFAANGKFLPTPEFVRAQGFDPRDKYSYFAKIEIQPQPLRTPSGKWKTLSAELAQQRTQSFLSHALPEIMACFPDWEDVQAGTWPPTDNTTVETKNK